MSQWLDKRTIIAYLMISLTLISTTSRLQAQSNIRLTDFWGQLIFHQSGILIEQISRHFKLIYKKAVVRFSRSTHHLYGNRHNSS